MPASKKTAIRSGFSSASSLISMLVKPYTAFVIVPFEVASVGGRAKKARYASECPSSRNMRRGASSVAAALTERVEGLTSVS